MREKDCKKNIQAEYDTLKNHRDCISDMVVELDGKLSGLQERLDGCEDRPVTRRAYLAAAEHCQKRLEAMKAALALADAELLHYLEILQ